MKDEVKGIYVVLGSTEGMMSPIVTWVPNLYKVPMSHFGLLSMRLKMKGNIL